MQQIADFLQRNPYAIIILSILGVIGGIIGIVTGWGQFINAIKGQVTVPKWAILLLSIIFLTVYINKGDKEVYPKDLERVIGKNFGIETVELDGKSFERCNFQGTQLIYRGYSFNLVENTLVNPSFLFAGPAARAFNLLSKLYQDPNARPVAEDMIENIKKGTVNSGKLPSELEKEGERFYE